MALRSYLISAAAIILLSCENREVENLNCTAASEAVKRYYTYLIEGNNVEFVSSFVGNDSLPPDYRAALDSNACDFIDVQNERHGGIKSVEVSSASEDSLNNVVDVYLTLNYGDSTQERVVVPMIKENEKWMMK